MAPTEPALVMAAVLALVREVALAMELAALEVVVAPLLVPEITAVAWVQGLM